MCNIGYRYILLDETIFSGKFFRSFARKIFKFAYSKTFDPINMVWVFCTFSHIMHDKIIIVIVEIVIVSL